MTTTTRTKQPTWETSVERARLAGLKSFEGRMEVAEASFEQIPPNGKSAGVHTLAQFAEEAGVEYSSLNQYRRIWVWIGRDLAQVCQIRSFSVAREAMDSGRWKTAKGFLRDRDRASLPEGFTQWTVDAVRVGLLEKKPTNTGKLVQQAVEENREPTTEEVTAAAIQDQLSNATPTAKAEVAAELLSDDKVIDAAYNDDQTALQIHRGSARLHSKDVQRDDERQRIQNNLTEDEQRWAKFQRHIRAGEFGLAEGQEKKFEVTDERSEWLRERADFYRYISRWLDAIAAHEEVTDDALQRFLNG